ncbi:MAG: GDP-mannose 4,6-dehydratase, partial [Candidatus Obscuribacterales bacterium]|nr:GDP-mannose 4,6-dehydratase [Candidatus Obscuribacterales bacterium]
MSKILVTGGAGFIGSHMVERLLAGGNKITVIDNFNDFYDPTIKGNNLKAALEHENFELVQGDIRNGADIKRVFESGPFDKIVHLAAMAGVRPSIENPALYMDVNVLGTQNLLDASLAQSKLPLFVFASSSSVYGERQGDSFKESDRTDRPISPYAASKMSGEMICHAAHKNNRLDVVGLRFFTVFGPRQRPDLAIYKFCRLIDEGEPIEVYGDGSTRRDYTYIKDIVDGVVKAMNLKKPGFEIINLGRSEPVILSDMISAIETSLGKKAKIISKPMQKGDVPNTFACIEKAEALLGYRPRTGLREGIDAFV